MNENTFHLNDEAMHPVRRKLVMWEWYTDVPVKVLFLHLMLKANFVEGNHKGDIVERGQHLTSYDHLAKETGLTVQQIRTAIIKLKSTGEITQEATNKGQRITLNNYET